MEFKNKFIWLHNAFISVPTNGIHKFHGKRICWKTVHGFFFKNLQQNELIFKFHFLFWIIYVVRTRRDFKISNNNMEANLSIQYTYAYVPTTDCEILSKLCLSVLGVVFIRLISYLLSAEHSWCIHFILTIDHIFWGLALWHSK